MSGNRELIARLEALLAETEKPSLPEVIRPAMSPFDVELDAEHIASVAREIEAINKYLISGQRGYCDVPTGHANAIRANFQAKGWYVEIVSVNPTFAKVWFRADGDPPLTTEAR